MDTRYICRMFTWFAGIQFVLSVWGVFIVVTTGQWADNEERCSDECISCEWTNDLPSGCRKYLPKSYFESRGLEVDANFQVIHKTQVVFFIGNLLIGVLSQFVYLGNHNRIYSSLAVSWGLAGGAIGAVTASYARERSMFFKDRAIAEEVAVHNLESELILQLTFVRTRMAILMEKQGLAISINDTVEEQRSIVALDNIQRKLQRELEGITLTLTYMRSIHGVCYGEFDTNMGCVTRPYYACIAAMSSLSSAMCFFLFLFVMYRVYASQNDVPPVDSREELLAQIRPELRHGTLVNTSDTYA